MISAIFGCIPRNLPQDSLTAEHAALSVALDNSNQAVYKGDCSSVLSSFHAGFGAAMQPGSVRACSAKAPYLRYGDQIADRIVSAVKVKAHRSLEKAIEDDGPLLGPINYWGNFHADSLARRGADLHAPPECDIILYTNSKRDLQNLARHMIDVLSELKLSRFEKRGKFERLPMDAPRLCGIVPKKDIHDFRWRHSIWVCIKCFARSKDPSSLCPSRSVCKGSSPFLKLLSNNSGHDLFTASVQGGGMIVFCKTCWYFASSYPRRLLDPCQGFAPERKSASRFYLQRCKHPVSKLRLMFPTPMRV